MGINAWVFIDGHRGLIGGAIWRDMQRLGFTRLTF
jgi:hypothetical protein